MSVRKELEKELYEFLDDMDPSGKNTERLRAYIAPMDDRKFYEYFDEFFSNPKKNIQVGYEAFDNPVNMKFIENLSKKYNIPMMEKVYKPYLTGDIKNPPASVYDNMVIYVPIKRLKQMVITKSHSSVTNSKRDSKTGQVTGTDKTARVTDVEAYSLMVQELYTCAQESFGPMSDDEAAAFEMQRQIQKNGEVSIHDLPNDPLDKVTMNTVNAFMLGSGLVTNMVDESCYLLPATLRERSTHKNAIER